MIEKTMIERLAQKLWETNAPEMAPDYDALDADDQVKVQLIVEVLLKEMLLPTKEMISAGMETEKATKGNVLIYENAQIIYRSMIEAALEG